MAWNEPGGGKDPWGSGGRGSNAPPDLEQMLKRLKERFSGRGGGGGEGGSGGPGKGPLMGAAIVLAGIVAALWLASGFYIVDEREQAVVLTFGSFTTVTEPGLRWHLPRPIQSVETINVTEIREVSDSQSMLTEDENIVEAELRVQYRVSDVEDYIFNVRDPDDALAQATKSALRAVVGENPLDFTLVEAREQVANVTRDRLQEILDNYGTGLFVTNVNLTDARAPRPVQDAFMDAIKAREDQQRLISEARAYANDRIPRARGEAARLREQSEGYRERVVARAEGDAARFTQLVAEVRRAPEVTRERLYFDTMQQVLSASSTVLVDIDGSGSVMMLPIEQMLKRMQQDQSGVARGDAAGPILGGGRTGSAIGERSPLPEPRSRERGTR